jgi:hypothetical protein
MRTEKYDEKNLHTRVANFFAIFLFLQSLASLEKYGFGFRLFTRLLAFGFDLMGKNLAEFDFRL